MQGFLIYFFPHKKPHTIWTMLCLCSSQWTSILCFSLEISWSMSCIPQHIKSIHLFYHFVYSCLCCFYFLTYLPMFCPYLVSLTSIITDIHLPASEMFCTFATHSYFLFLCCSYKFTFYLVWQVMQSFPLLSEVFIPLSASTSTLFFFSSLLH